MSIVKHAAFCSMACLALMASPPIAQEAPDAGASDAPFRVGAGDDLRIDFYLQPELSRVYPVRPDGEIGVHLLGTIPVEGLTISEVEVLLRDRAQEVFQSTQASVVVDVDRFRDIYVQGAVSDPGAFAYRPGLTAMQAVALAGGTSGGSLPRDTSLTDLNRILEKQRDFAVIQGRIEQQERRLARVDSQLGEGAEADPLASLETQIVQTRVRGYELRRDLAEAEGEILRQNRDILDDRLERAEDEVERVADLNDRGLVRTDRVQEVEERVDRFRSDQLDVSAEAARAERVRADAENAADLARLDYREGLLRERAQIEETLQTARIEARAVRDALRQLGGAPVPALGGEASEIWTVFRDGPSGLRTIEAERDMRLMPGDVLSVVVEAETL